jgi:hypothetical protein
VNYYGILMNFIYVDAVKYPQKDSLKETGFTTGRTSWVNHYFRYMKGFVTEAMVVTGSHVRSPFRFDQLKLQTYSGVFLILPSILNR